MPTLTLPKILAIDDTPANLMSLGVMMIDDMDLHVASSGAAGLALAAQIQPDLILLDVMMPDMDGYETCRQLKADPRLGHIPVIFLTARADEESERDGLGLGAADYITKPIKLAVAKHRISNLLERETLRREVTAQRDALQRLVGELQQASAQLHQLAFFDPLTQLPNRRLLLDRLGQTLAAAKRSGQYLALMFLDLDNFKPLNDRHGHAVGDSLLEEVAARLTTCVRQVDTVARLGGDEFVVVLADLHAAQDTASALALTVAEKIRTSLSEPYHLVSQGAASSLNVVSHACTVSMGVTVFLPESGTEEDFLKRADTAMYHAKAAGRNQIHLYDATV
jgi:diguanylate cyclase (GGDEF)-like protein